MKEELVRDKWEISMLNAKSALSILIDMPVYLFFIYIQVYANI